MRLTLLNETKEKEDENAKPQPTEITIIEKRSVPRYCLVQVSLLNHKDFDGSLIYIGLELYNYFA